MNFDAGDISFWQEWFLERLFQSAERAQTEYPYLRDFGGEYQIPHEYLLAIGATSWPTENFILSTPLIYIGDFGIVSVCNDHLELQHCS